MPWMIFIETPIIKAAAGNEDPRVVELLIDLGVAY